MSRSTQLTIATIGKLDELELSDLNDDAMQATIAGIESRNIYLRRKTWTHEIILLTNGDESLGAYGDAKIKELDIDLAVLGLDEENKPDLKRKRGVHLPPGQLLYFTHSNPTSCHIDSHAGSLALFLPNYQASGDTLAGLREPNTLTTHHLPITRSFFSHQTHPSSPVDDSYPRLPSELRSPLPTASTIPLPCRFEFIGGEGETALVGNGDESLSLSSLLCNPGGRLQCYPYFECGDAGREDPVHSTSQRYLRKRHSSLFSPPRQEEAHLRLRVDKSRSKLTEASPSNVTSSCPLGSNVIPTVDTAPSPLRSAASHRRNTGIREGFIRDSMLGGCESGRDAE
ncbi:hypothetical protein BT96DRAFT_1006885 [Gymnopus androsaceus JB14]|uniref:Uncharacterized protein n=1 Tax=Gymnopus androsaceus JB14 TaxID=1447944 RepID=A0A6A4GJ54_9AGAR|nr:hypothetical protein BT96DRAFT_1006885 [Gymnopus androsaceus JB14]